MINNKYENVEDFLIDNTFQEYCAGGNEQCIQYWNNYLHKHPEQEGTMMQAKRLYHILVGNKKPLNAQVDKLKADIRALAPMAPVSKFQFSFWIKTAAALIILAGGLLWGIQHTNTKEISSTSADVTYITANGEKKTVELADGSKVTLNAGSKLFMDKGFNVDERHVHLTGEAFFDVSSDKEKPFVVHTQDFDIRVLGTSFNVKAYPEETTSEAVLIHGLIEMKSKRGNENLVILKPNQKVTIYKAEEKMANKESIKKVKKSQLKEIAIQDLEPEEDHLTLPDVAWKENRLEIIDQDFSSLQHVLERWYDVEIQLQDQHLQDYRFTATFNRESIDQVLSALQKVEPFKYTIYGKKITIYK
jgi:transmembrane sensor